jgi:serine/threonine-protein kinase RsbT
VLVRASTSAHPKRIALTGRGGVVGSRVPSARVVTVDVAYGDTLVLATDGLRSGFASAVAVHEDPQATADALLSAFGRDTDDACVLVARYLGGTCPYAVVPLGGESDVVMARKHAREIAVAAGLGETGSIAFATAVTEVARNVVVHAGSGELVVSVVTRGPRVGVVASARDEGPGIAAPDRALEDGWSTGTGLGLGLPSARRLVDELDLDTAPGTGTRVTLRKWAR